MSKIIDVEYNKFTGIDNISKDTRVDKGEGSIGLFAAVNIDIDDDYAISLRSAVPAYIDKFGDSFWASLTAPSGISKFKRAMPRGHLTEMYKNRLYSAIDNMIVFSDAAAWGRYDIRIDPILLDSRVTMLKGVDNGMYISDLNTTYFMSGLTPNPKSKNAFILKEIDNKGAVEGSAVKVGRVMIGKTIIENAVGWLSDNGVFIGGSNGMFINATEGKYLPPQGLTKAQGVLKTDLGFNQYVVILQ